MSRSLWVILMSTLTLAGCDSAPTAETGEACFSGNDCLSGHCIEIAEGAARRSFCTGKCDSPADCPTSAKGCEDIGLPWSAGALWCVPPTPQ